MRQKGPPDKERRDYIRLDSVFPVRFRLLSIDGKHLFSDWLQGFTNNVGKGGICLSVNSLKQELAGLLKEHQAKLSLIIEMPLFTNPVNARAGVSWVKGDPGQPGKYFIGLNYEQIDHLESRRIVNYARGKKLFIPAALSAVMVLAAALLINGFMNMKLARGNKELVRQLVKVMQESIVAKDRIKQAGKERNDLEGRIQELEMRISKAQEERLGLEGRLKQEAALESRKTEELNKLIAQLTKEKADLKERLDANTRRVAAVSEDILGLGIKQAELKKANLEKMYQWLKVHQNPRTGLVMSFEGDNDIAEWAFTYDQSLAAQAYSHFSDFQRSRKIFDFFNTKAKRQGPYFFNAYYVFDGNPAEYVVTSGPNIWLGIAIAQYTAKTKDPGFMSLAEQIAQGIIELQKQDSDGGIRGGPDISWYSTEHNLDAYAFFNMLYKITGKLLYQEAAGRVLDWLTQHTYDKYSLPVKRGKGDSTIATDTYAWSIAAIGPEKLEELGMNPDRIVEFAEENCSVRVSYSRPEGGAVTIKGFDFAAQRNVARGGVVSSEWTAQMIMAFKIMEDFYHKKGMALKAAGYAAKADEYLSELCNMIISSPSASGQGEICLPYASQDFVDTGHGWSSPKGKSTGSLAGTAYALFAYYNYNPLRLKE